MHYRFNGTYTAKNKLCASGFNENGKYNVTTKVQSVTCEEAFVGIGQRTWPGVACIAEVSYTCSK
jgi:hypothetical protein